MSSKLFTAFSIRDKLELRNRILRDSIHQGFPIRCIKNIDVGFDHEKVY